jgi:thioredoxin 1
MGGQIVNTTDTTFDNDIQTDHLVLIDFWAEWCGPCRAVAPVVEELSKEYEGRLKVLKVNVDDNQETAIRYQIMSIPTLLFLKGGKAVGKIVGAEPKSSIKDKIDSLLAA